MKKLFRIFVLILLSNSAFSHDYWMLFNSARKKVVIGCGHNFPVSSFLLKRSLLHRVQIKIAGRGMVKLKIKKSGTKWTASIPSLSPGIYAGQYVIKKEGDDEPVYYAKFIHLHPPANSKKKDFIIGHGLEIVPDLSLKKKIRNSLPVFLLYNGRNISGQVSVTEEKGSVYYRYVSKQRGCTLPVKTGKRYLITARYKGKSCSLTLGL